MFRICLVWQAHWFAERLTSEQAQREPGAFKQSWRTLSHTEYKTNSNTRIQTIGQTCRQRCQRSKEPGRSNSLVLALFHTESKTDTLEQLETHRHRQTNKNYQRCQGSTQTHRDKHEHMEIIENKHGVKIVETVFSKVILRFIWNKDKGTKQVHCFINIDCNAMKAKWF